MVLMVGDHIRMSVYEIKDEDYFSPVTELEDDENEEVPVIMVLLNTFQMMNMCPILRMVFHAKIRTDLEVKYWLCGRGIRLY